MREAWINACLQITSSILFQWPVRPQRVIPIRCVLTDSSCLQCIDDESCQGCVWFSRELRCTLNPKYRLKPSRQFKRYDVKAHRKISLFTFYSNGVSLTLRLVVVCATTQKNRVYSRFFVQQSESLFGYFEFLRQPPLQSLHGLF